MKEEVHSQSYSKLFYLQGASQILVMHKSIFSYSCKSRIDKGCILLLNLRCHTHFSLLILVLTTKMLTSANIPLNGETIFTYDYEHLNEI